VLVAADSFNGAPGEQSGQSIHWVVSMSKIAVEGGANFLCSAKSTGKCVVVAAPLDDPRWCPTCLRCRPEGGSEVRIVAVLHSV
jgi:hypothetical protein